MELSRFGVVDNAAHALVEFHSCDETGALFLLFQFFKNPKLFSD